MTPGADLIESLHRCAGWIVGSFEHQWRHGADKHGFCQAPGAMPADITRNFTAARRMTDVDRIFQIEFLDQLGEIVGISVHIVAVP